MSVLAIIAILLGACVLFSAGIVVGALLSWAGYEEGFRDGEDSAARRRSVQGPTENAPASRKRSGAEPRGVSS